MTGIELRKDYSAVGLRALARKSRDAKQARRLMALAGVADGLSRADAARFGLMDRQTLRDWVHRFNQYGPHQPIGKLVHTGHFRRVIGIDADRTVKISFPDMADNCHYDPQPISIGTGLTDRLEYTWQSLLSTL